MCHVVHGATSRSHEPKRHKKKIQGDTGEEMQGRYRGGEERRYRGDLGEGRYRGEQIQGRRCRKDT